MYTHTHTHTHTRTHTYTHTHIHKHTHTLTQMLRCCIKCLVSQHTHTYTHTHTPTHLLLRQRFCMECLDACMLPIRVHVADTSDAREEEGAQKGTLLLKRRSQLLYFLHHFLNLPSDTPPHPPSFSLASPSPAIRVYMCVSTCACVSVYFCCKKFSKVSAVVIFLMTVGLFCSGEPRIENFCWDRIGLLKAGVLME